MRPEATGLRTKRTQSVAARSAVKRPRPVTSAGSSSRRMARPTQGIPDVIPEPAVASCMSAFRSIHRSIGLDVEGARQWCEPGVEDFRRISRRFELEQRAVDEIAEA